MATVTIITMMVVMDLITIKCFLSFILSVFAMIMTVMPAIALHFWHPHHAQAMPVHHFAALVAGDGQHSGGKQHNDDKPGTDRFRAALFEECP